MKHINTSSLMLGVRSSIRNKGVATHATLRNYFKLDGQDVDALNDAIRRAITAGLIVSEQTDKVYRGSPVFVLRPTSQYEASVKEAAIPPWEV